MLQKLINQFTKNGISPIIELSIYNNGKKYYFQNGIEKENMFYDIASLTKCVISTITLQEISNGNIAFQDKINDYLEYLQDFNVTIEELLTHKTGFDIIKKFDNKLNYSVSEINNFIKNENNIVLDKTKACYSNLNYIYLGDFLEKYFGKILENIVNDFSKNYNLNFKYKPLENGILKENIFLTMYFPGIVHDPITRYLGGISGAAGLFSTHKTLHEFGKKWLNNEFNLKEEIYMQDFSNLKNIEDYGICFRKGRYDNEFVEFSGHTGPSIFLSKKYNILITLSCNICMHENTKEKREKYMEFKRKLLNLIKKSFL